jgi:hypothetical protein
LILLLSTFDVPGDLGFERALLHLVILVLQALPELLEALLPVLIPLQVPLICRALLPLVSMWFLRFLQLGKVVVACIVADGGGGRVRRPVVRVDLGRVVQVGVEVVEGGNLEGLRGTGEDLRGLCVMLWQAPNRLGCLEGLVGVESRGLVNLSIIVV